MLPSLCLVQYTYARVVFLHTNSEKGSATRLILVTIRRFGLTGTRVGGVARASFSAIANMMFLLRLFAVCRLPPALAGFPFLGPFPLFLCLSIRAVLRAPFCRDDNIRSEGWRFRMRTWPLLHHVVPDLASFAVHFVVFAAVCALKRPRVFY